MLYAEYESRVNLVALKEKLTRLSTIGDIAWFALKDEHVAGVKERDEIDGFTTFWFSASDPVIASLQLSL